MDRDRRHEPVRCYGYNPEGIRVGQGAGRRAQQIHFWPCTDRSIAENTACRIYVRGIEALYAEIEPHGIVHPNAPLATKAWGAREFGMVDLDGNLITFAERE